MRNFIREWGVVFAIAILLGGFAGTALAGSCSPFGDCTEMNFAAMTAIGNTDGQCNPHGQSGNHLVSLVNGGAGEFTMWLQDGPTLTGPWSNSTTTAQTYNTNDTNAFRHRGIFEAGPCFRFHTTDINITSVNTITPTLQTRR